jgi:hypothetical protein
MLLAPLLLVSQRVTQTIVPNADLRLQLSLDPISKREAVPVRRAAPRAAPTQSARGFRRFDGGGEVRGRAVDCRLECRMRATRTIDDATR